MCKYEIYKRRTLTLSIVGEREPQTHSGIKVDSTILLLLYSL
jgi:hypothetical protein